ncbi:deoxyhypusine synthase [Candidatus Woesearchaeota archaeon]|nr:deoxyhypusine synthase [Candidatus Woesearchaeota archaeon]
MGSKFDRSFLLERSKTAKMELVKLKNLDLSKCNSFDDLTKAMSMTAFGGRQLGEAVDVAEAMIKDKDCLKVLTLSGAITIAKMNLVICDMIDNGMVDVIIATGALVSHGFIDGAGFYHYKNPGHIPDEELLKLGYDRVYDSLETEENFDAVAKIFYATFNSMAKDDYICSYRIFEKLGEYLTKHCEGRNVFKSAHSKKIPIFIPAFLDSDIGIEFYLNNQARKDKGEEPLTYEPIFDLEKYVDLVFNAKKVGIFTIGGGVPRNWAQQVGPILQWNLVRMDKKLSEEEIKKYSKRFSYGVRICPEPVHWGGLSGCTYSEGVSWGKFTPVSEGGRYAEVMCDATIAWPIIVKALLERLKGKKR